MRQFFLLLSVLAMSTAFASNVQAVQVGSGAPTSMTVVVAATIAILIILAVVVTATVVMSNKNHPPVNKPKVDLVGVFFEGRNYVVPVCYDGECWCTPFQAGLNDDKKVRRKEYRAAVEAIECRARYPQFAPEFRRLIREGVITEVSKERRSA